MQKKAYVTITTVLLLSCSQSYTPKQEQEKTAIKDIPALQEALNFDRAANMQQLQNAIFPTTAPQQFNLTTTSRTTIKSQKGAEIKIEPGLFETRDGSAMGDDLKISVIECDNTTDLLKYDIGTVSNDRLLVANNSYHISCTSAGKELQLKKGKSITVTFPRITDNRMSLFYGSRDDMGLFNWEYSGPLKPLQVATTVEHTTFVVTSKDSVINKYHAPQKKKEPKMAWGNKFSNRREIQLGTGRHKDTLVVAKDPTTTIATSTTTTAKKMLETKTISANSAYAKITRLGWICSGYFYDAAEKMKLSLRVPTMPHGAVVKTYIIFKKMNCIVQQNIIAGAQANNDIIDNLPANADVRVIALCYYNGKVHASSNGLKLARNTFLSLNLKEMDDKDLKQVMALKGTG